MKTSILRKHKVFHEIPRCPKCGGRRIVCYSKVNVGSAIEDLECRQCGNHEVTIRSLKITERQMKEEIKAMQKESTDGIQLLNMETGELTPSGQIAAAQFEIQCAIAVAKKMPRDENQAYQGLMQSCERQSFAEKGVYKYPRGGKPVIGASVYLAREFARQWGNIRTGCDIIVDEGETRVLRAWAWDLQTNAKEEETIAFKKLIQRKNDKTGNTEWIVPDERDLLELTNRNAAKGKRNCILHLLPKDMIEDAMEKCKEVTAKKVKENPSEALGKMIAAFAAIKVTKAMLESYLKHPVEKCTEEEIADLTITGKSIKEGVITWADFVRMEEEKSSENGNPSDSLI